MNVYICRYVYTYSIYVYISTFTWPLAARHTAVASSQTAREKTSSSMTKPTRRLSRHDAPSQRDRSQVTLRSQSCQGLGLGLT